MIIPVLALVIAGHHATSTQTLACEIGGASPASAPDSVVASQLVADAAVIVRARVVQENGAGPAVTSGVATTVRFERIEVLKAADSVPPFFAVTPGASVDLDEFNTQAVPYRVVRRSGLAGTC